MSIGQEVMSTDKVKAPTALVRVLETLFVTRCRSVVEMSMRIDFSILRKATLGNVGLAQPTMRPLAVQTPHSVAAPLLLLHDPTFGICAEHPVLSSLPFGLRFSTTHDLMSSHSFDFVARLSSMPVASAFAAPPLVADATDPPNTLNFRTWFNRHDTIAVGSRTSHCCLIAHDPLVHRDLQETSHFQLIQKERDLILWQLILAILTGTLHVDLLIVQLRQDPGMEHVDTETMVATIDQN